MGFTRTRRLAFSALFALILTTISCVTYWLWFSPTSKSSVLVEVGVRRHGNESLQTQEQRRQLNALLATAKYADAVRSARQYYNVAPLNSIGEAISKLAEAISGSNHSDSFDVQEMLRQQEIGARSPESPSLPNLLSNIPVDVSSLDVRLRETPSATGLDALTERGELLLTTGKATEARQAFLTVLKRLNKADKTFFAAVEGVARSLRVESASEGPANAFVIALMVGRHPGALSELTSDQWNSGNYQIAGERLALAQISKSEAGVDVDLPETVSTSADAATMPSGGAVSKATRYDLGRPLIAASVAPEPDRALNEWLAAWEKRIELPQAATGVTNEGERTTLASILQRTNLPSTLLFHLGHSIQFSGKGDGIDTLFYEEGAHRLKKELEAAPGVVHQAAIVRSLKDHLGGFRRVLWPRIAAGDRDALAGLIDIYQIYIKYAPPGDKSLQKPVTHIKVGLVECLSFTDHPADGLAILDSIPADVVKLEKLQRPVAWYYGSIYFGKQEFTKAIPQLVAVADTDFSLAPRARELLLMALIRTGKSSDARERFNSWEEQGKLSETNPELRNQLLAQLTNVDDKPIDSADATSVQVIDPAQNVGKPLIFLEQIRPNERLRQGKWLVVLYHHDCELCKRALPDLVRRAGQGEQVAFVEIPPYAPKGLELLNDAGTYVKAKLDDRSWFFPMLTRFEIENGVVMKAMSGEAVAP